MIQDQLIAPEVLNARILDRHDLTSELSIVRVQPDSGFVPDFVPGQFIKLGLPRAEAEAAVVARAGRERSGPRLIRRAYSIASSPLQRDHLEFLMVRVDVGKLTPRIWTIEPGGRIWMEDHVAGQFTLDAVPPDKDLVMIATGTGLAPFVSMLRTYARKSRWRRAAVVNGVRYAADLAYRTELEAMTRSDARISYIPIVSREPQVDIADSGWRGLRGRVQQVLEPGVFESLTGIPLVPAECHVMLCGNPEMIVQVQGTLEARGFHAHSSARPGNIHFERYW
jgi:ferredoxin--NADP+ reductase